VGRQRRGTLGRYIIVRIAASILDRGHGAFLEAAAAGRRRGIFDAIELFVAD